MKTAKERNTMDKQLLNETIERNDLFGRSFTYGVAFVTLVKGGYFRMDEESVDDIQWQLAEHLAAVVDGDARKIYDNLSLEALVEAVDIAVIDEIVTASVEDDGDGEA